MQFLSLESLARLGYWLSSGVRLIAVGDMSEDIESRKKFREQIVFFQGDRKHVQPHFELFVDVVEVFDRFPRSDPGNGINLTPEQVWIFLQFPRFQEASRPIRREETPKPEIRVVGGSSHQRDSRDERKKENHGGDRRDRRDRDRQHGGQQGQRGQGGEQKTEVQKPELQQAVPVDEFKGKF